MEVMASDRTVTMTLHDAEELAKWLKGKILPNIYLPNESLTLWHCKLGIYEVLGVSVQLRVMSRNS